MKRGAAIVDPKDAAAIIGLADLGPGMRVVEAGVGSGALTCSLLRAVGPAGSVTSIELRSDFAEIARSNVQRWLGAMPEHWTLIEGAAEDHLADQEVEAVVLDLLAPWECTAGAFEALVPGGVFVAYVASTTQMSRLVETLRDQGGWTEPAASETLLRGWHVQGLAVRPDHRMQGHTGFLVWARRLADGSPGLPRRVRPAHGAYGADYDGPGAAAGRRATGRDAASPVQDGNSSDAVPDNPVEQ